MCRVPLRNWTFTFIEFRLKQLPGVGAYCGGSAPSPPGTPVGVWGRGEMTRVHGTQKETLVAQGPFQKKTTHALVRSQSWG